MSEAPEEPDQADATPEEANSGAERRRYERTTVLWQGTLVLPERSLDCVIVNISASGAMVQLSEQVDCEGTVSLSSPRFGTFSADTVWHKDKQLGLNFNEDVERVARMLGEILT